MRAASTPGTKVVAGELYRVRRGRRKRFSAELTPEPGRRPARVAVMLALAHTIQRAIDRGEIRDQAEAARKLGLTRARMTQILDLTLLAPDLQEVVLSLGLSNGQTAISAKDLKCAVRSLSWVEQRHLLRPRPRPQLRS